MNESLPVSYVSPEEKQWAVFGHLSGLCGYFIPLGNVIGPLAIWLMKKDESVSIATHAKNALNFHISMTIWISIAAIASVFIIGIPVLAALGIFELVATIIGTVKASKGERWNYPLTIEFIK